MEDISFSDCPPGTFSPLDDQVLEGLDLDAQFFDSPMEVEEPYFGVEPDHYDAMVDANVAAAGAVDPFPNVDTYRDVIAAVPSYLTHRAKQNSQKYPDLVLMMRECRYQAEKRRARGVMTLRGVMVDMRRLQCEDTMLLYHIFRVCTVLDHYLLLSYAFLGCKPQFVSMWYHIFGGTRLSRFSHFFWKWCRTQLMALSGNYVFYVLGMIDCTEMYAKAAIALLPSDLETQAGFATWVFNQAAALEGAPMSLPEVARVEAKFTWRRNADFFRGPSVVNAHPLCSWINFLHDLDGSKVNLAAALDLALHVNDIANIITLWFDGHKSRALFTLFGYVYRYDAFMKSRDDFLRVIWKHTFNLDPDHPSMAGRCLEGAAELFDRYVLGIKARRAMSVDSELEREFSEFSKSEPSPPPEVPELAYTESITDALLLKKFFAVLAATQVPRVLTLMPDFAQTFIQKLSVFTLTGSDGITLLEKVSEFVEALIDVCREFVHTMDFRVFLRAGGSSTYVARVNEFFQKQAKENRSVCIHQWIEKATELEAEGAQYYAKPYVSYTVTKSYEILRTRLNTWISQVGAMANRKKRPFPLVLIGQPGNAKTSVMEDFARFAASVSPKYAHNERDAYGVLKELGGVLYTAPMQDSHWNNCVDPFMVHANDLAGDGHSENKFNVAALLQTAIDIVPFWTPQASIDDKIANSTIDPAIFAVSSNDNCWNFKPFGTNHAKLIRRYQKHAYIVEYPPECYSVAPTAASLGVLKDPEMEADPDIVRRLSYFRVKMYHENGMIWFYRKKLVCVGYDNFMLHIKKEYQEHCDKVADRERGPTCNLGTPWEVHTAPCLRGCSWKSSELDAPNVEEGADGEPSGGDPQPDEETTSELAVVERTEMFLRCVFSHKVTFPEQPIEIKPVVDKELADYLKSVRSESVKWRKIFATVRELIPKAVAALTAAVFAYKALVLAQKVFFSRESAPAPGKDDPVVKTHAPEAINKPVPATFSDSYLARYGIKEAKKIEIPSPPGWQDISRSLIWISQASPTTTPKDFYPFVRNNLVELRCGTGMFTHGLFVTPEVLLLNKHFFVHIKGQTVQVSSPGDVSSRMSFVVSRFYDVPNEDLVFVRVPAFPANNIVKHFADEHGIRAKATVDFGNTYTEATYHSQVVRAVMSLPMGSAYVYPTNVTYQGYCGHPLVVEVNNHPMIVGIHAARLKNGDGSAAPVSRKVVDQALKELSSPVFPYVESLIIPNTVEGIAPLMAKSGLRSAPPGTPIDVVGTVSRVTGLKRSSYAPTKLYGIAVSLLREPRVIPNLASKGVLVGDSWLSPEVHKFTGMSYRPSYPLESLLDIAVADYVDQAPRSPIPLHPLDLKEALFGVLGDPLLKNVNMSTSSGIYEGVGGKRALIDPLTKEIDADFKTTVVTLIEKLEKSLVVFHQKWARKDEIVTAEKDKKRKYRFFMISDMESLVLFRVFLAPLVAHMYRNKEFFECYGAFNPASPEFGVMYGRLRKFAHVMLCDMKHMDSSHRTFTTRYVALVFRKLAMDNGYNEHASNVVYNLVYGIVFNLCELNGDVFFINEGMGSGVYITFILNCVVTSLLFRAAWFRDHKEPFRDHVVLATGGDDSATSTDHVDFNVLVVQEVAKMLGYEIVPATDKDGEVKPFDAWQDFVFLKRSPATIETSSGPLVVGVLDQDSIWKSLGWWDVTRDVSEEDRMAQALDAAQREMALYGEEALLRFQKTVGNIYKYDVKEYHDIIEKYVLGKLYDQTPEQCAQEVWEQMESVLPLTLWSHGAEKLMANSPGRAALGGGPANILPYLLLVTACVILSLFNGHAGALSEYCKTSIFLFRIGWHVEIWVKSVVDIEPNLILGVTDSNSTVNSTFSGTAEQDIKSTAVFRQELLRVADSGIKPTPLYRGLTVKNTNLERVVQVNTTYSISSSATGVAELFDVYAVWASSPLMQKQLSGYRFFRGRPFVRVTVSGDPQYYGKVRLVAQCGGGYDGQNVGYDNQELVNVIQAMMCPIGIDIDPSRPAAYEMELPFVSCNGWYDRSFAIQGTSYTPPTLSICQAIIAPLRTVANTIGNPQFSFTFSIFMKDVEQAVPILFASESEVPSMLPPTATSAVKAVKLGLSTAGELARRGSKALESLGFARPNNPDVQVEGPLFNGSSSGATYSAPKLSNDINQSTAPGPDASGIGAEDDATVHNLVAHPSWIVSQAWTTSAFFLEIPVAPGYGSTTSQDTPLRLVNRMFKYWRGSIIYDIEVICNGFHRGSLSISYVAAPSNAYLSGINNASFYPTTILDLAVTRKVSITVPHTSANYWQNCKDTITAFTGERQAYLVITPVARLSVPAGAKDATVNVLVTARGGPDFAVAVPDYTRIISYYPRTVAAGGGSDTYESLVLDTIESNITEVQPVEEIPVLYTSNQDEVQRIAIGERCDNLNMLLRRRFLAYTFNNTFAPAVGKSRYTMAVPTEPPCTNVTVTTSNLSGVARLTPYMVLAPCFLGRRGGWRVTVQFDQMIPKLSELGTAYVTLANMGVNVPNMGAFANGGDYSTINQGMYEMYPLNAYRPMIEYEIPSFIRTNFRNSRNDYLGMGTISLLDYNAQPPFALIVTPTLATPVTGTSDVISGYIHYAAADDFSLYKFWWIPSFTST